MHSFFRIILGLFLGATAWAAPNVQASLARVEGRLHGRIGLFAMRGSATLGHRADERFAYCSTFKWVLGAAVLKRVEVGGLRLDQMLGFGEKDLLPHSPVTGAHLREGRLSVGELCAATITLSDNTAANLLEAQVGGLSGMQAFVRSLGDGVMRFDRLEPELNRNLPGDPRDTTSPKAMAQLLRTALETEALSKPSRERLLAWMKAATTGQNRIRAGVPQGWVVGDKTGTGERGAANDVAIIFPPQGEPIYLCVFVDSDQANAKAREAAIAEVARLVLATLR
jgi:beta-lactamase class A